MSCARTSSVLPPNEKVWDTGVAFDASEQPLRTEPLRTAAASAVKAHPTVLRVVIGSSG
ncbi:hypothetical protein Msi02_41730 [Microbispora siamensis]|uniref:Uncharacterized protein n=1 Tax=Microbispora siamensis TaxID=564413 RepID=A0ABQ4GPJ5_9ACTN|nr:hypothetical protein Msi02_41730 [Microbispora siamensis]